ncbi:MAG: PIN domain-containing protein [Gammaproteobacteria bacterium]|nr:PIN domain-containing protein [Gammaproteobacteria bacterium]NNJ84076.1 PIN domain-containing protein [Gammaproteobacteria bacterium]
MNGYLLDACALIALLNDEPGADTVEALLTGKPPIFMSAINVLEVSYDAVRRSRQAHAAALVLELVRQAGIDILWSLTESELLAAAQWKARGKLSMADALALGIAETRALRLVSADHHELDPLEAQGLVQVEWIR